ncbi:hypothetical protein DFP73DRAFT_597384 [Morchella snyderi]|nr:hypothetical protein DFP73DRAFT_597384 [Morchella snyderi]
MEEKGFISPELGTGDFYTSGLQFQEPWPGGNMEGFAWLNEPGLNANPGSRDSGTPNSHYNSVWAEWDDTKNAYMVDKGQSSYKTSNGTENNLPSATSGPSLAMVENARDIAEKTESKETEAPYNYLMFKDVGNLQSAFLEGTDSVVSRHGIEEHIVKLKLRELFPPRLENGPGFGDNLPALPVPPIEPFPTITVDPKRPTEDEETKRIKAATMAKYIYLTRAYVFEYQKAFPLMHQHNLEVHGENYGLMECMELYRYTVKKHAADIPEFLPGLTNPE